MGSHSIWRQLGFGADFFWRRPIWRRSWFGADRFGAAWFGAKFFLAPVFIWRRPIWRHFFIKRFGKILFVIYPNRTSHGLYSAGLFGNILCLQPNLPYWILTGSPISLQKVPKLMYKLFNPNKHSKIINIFQNLPFSQIFFNYEFPNNTQIQ